MKLGQSGSAVVEYLMLVILISAVAVPIIYNKFGGPFVETLQTERGKLVNFIGQTPKNRKPPVPSEWFSQEKPARPDSQTIGGANDLGEQPPLETGAVGEPGNVTTGDLDGGPGSAKDLKDPNAINMGSAAGRGGGYSGVGSAGAGEVAGGNDFFGTPPQTPGRTFGGQGSGEETGAGGSRRGGGTSGENAPEGEAGEKAKDSAASQGQQAKGEEARGGENKKRRLVEAEDELKERAQSKKFDWWLLIKVLIVLFIIALIFLILIGNTRRSG
ncbi:hypothetical protein EBQ90_10050, partial [bacterium]|nr:hypothetical protein [bacterium]